MFLPSGLMVGGVIVMWSAYRYAAASPVEPQASTPRERDEPEDDDL